MDLCIWLGIVVKVCERFDCIILLKYFSKSVDFLFNR